MASSVARVSLAESDRSAVMTAEALADWCWGAARARAAPDQSRQAPAAPKDPETHNDQANRNRFEAPKAAFPQ